MATIIMTAESEATGTSARRTFDTFDECTVALISSVTYAYKSAEALAITLKWLKNDGSTGFQFEHTCPCGNCGSKLVVSYLP